MYNPCSAPWQLAVKDIFIRPGSSVDFRGDSSRSVATDLQAHHGAAAQLAAGQSHSDLYASDRNTAVHTGRRWD